MGMDPLLEWPGPVVRVQSLAESGASAIPDVFVKPPSERPVISPACTKAGGNLSIPVIDLGGLVDGAGAVRAVAAAVSDACREWGFFQVVNHGVNAELMARARELWREFFHLPMEAKEAYANSPATYEGYGSRLGFEKGAVLDWTDYFFLVVVPESMRSYGKWPARPTSLRETIEEYTQEMMKLSRLLIKLLSVSLELDEDYIHKAFGGDDAEASMRVGFYPRCPQPELTYGLSQHSDPGGLTVLLADDCVKGLQVRNGDKWSTVQPAPNAFIINIGDQIQVLSNAIYKSVEHRVFVNSTFERLSIAFFYNPNNDLPIGPAQKLLTLSHPQLYQPMPYKEYRMFVRMKGPRGKEQVESLRALHVV